MGIGDVFYTRVGETLPGFRVPLIFLRAQRFCGPSGSPSRVRGTQRRGAARGGGPTFPQHPVRDAGQHPHGCWRRGVLRRAGVPGRPGPPLENPRGGPFWAGSMLGCAQRLRGRWGGGGWAPVKGPARHGKKGPALSLARPARLTNSTAANDILERLFRAQVTPNPRKTLQ